MNAGNVNKLKIKSVVNISKRKLKNLISESIIKKSNIKTRKSSGLIKIINIELIIL